MDDMNRTPLRGSVPSNEARKSRTIRIDLTKKLFDEYEINDSIIDSLDSVGFFTKPASLKYHGCYEGGLFDHSYQVAECLIDLTKGMNLTWERKRSPALVGLLHDLCKCYQYHKLDSGEYVYSSSFSGHGSLSVTILKKLFDDDITEEEELCVRYHMGAYTRDDWDGFDQAIRKYRTVLYTHTADMLASKVFNL